MESQFFYSCLWECILASPVNRLAAVNYILSHFNRKKSLEDQIYFIGSNVNLLVITVHVFNTLLECDKIFCKKKIPVFTVGEHNGCTTFTRKQIFPF